MVFLVPNFRPLYPLFFIIFSISQEEPSIQTTYADRVKQLKNKIKAKHSQVVSNNASNPNRFYNVTISLKTRENLKSNDNQVKFTFVRKSKRSTVLHVSGDCLFTDMLSMARDNFRVNKVTECYLATSKGEVLSTRGKKLITFINLNKSTKKRPQIYLHYLNTYAHFLWHGEVMQYLDNEDDHDNDADIGSPQLQQQDQGDRSDQMEFSNLSEVSNVQDIKTKVAHLVHEHDMIKKYFYISTILTHLRNFDKLMGVRFI